MTVMITIPITAFTFSPPSRLYSSGRLDCALHVSRSGPSGVSAYSRDRCVQTICRSLSARPAYIGHNRRIKALSSLAVLYYALARSWCATPFHTSRRFGV